MAGANTVGIAYVERGVGGHTGVFFRRSTDGGVTWKPRVLISASGRAVSASIAGAGSRFDIVWSEVLNDVSRVWYIRSIDAGATWGAKQAISVETQEASQPRVARDTFGTVAVVWAGFDTSLGTRVWSRVSTNGGKTFAASPVLVSTAHSNAAQPAVAIGRDGVIHVAHNTDVFGLLYQRSSNGGQTWTAPLRLANHAESAFGPTIAASGRTVIVGYTRLADGPQRWIAYRRSPDNGLHWEARSQLSTRAGQNTQQAVFSVADGRWRAVFARCHNAACDEVTIHLRISTDKGRNWSGPRLVGPAVPSRVAPMGAIGRAHTVVAWARGDEDGTAGAVIARRSD